MGLETATYISGLNANNPINATDVVGEGDDHLRLIKSTLLNTFPGITGAMSLTHTQLNNAAIKNEANQFTAAQQLRAGTPELQWYETDAGADEKLWSQRVSGDALQLLTRTDADGAGETLLSATRTGTAIGQVDLRGNPVSLYQQAVEKMRTHTTGIRVAGSAAVSSPPVAADSPDTQLELFGTFAGGVIGYLGYDNTGNLVLKNNCHGGAIKIRAEDNAGANNVLFEGDPDAESIIHYAGAAVLQTQVGGIRVNDDSGAAPRIDLYDDSGNLLARVQEEGPQFAVRGLVHGNNVLLSAEDALGSTRNLLIGDPDGDTKIYHSGELRIETESDGINQVKPDSSDTGNNLLRFNHANGTLRGFVGNLSGGAMSLRCNVDSALTQIQGRNSSGTIRNEILCDPDADVALCYAGAIEFQTRDSNAAGVTSGAEVNDHGGTFRDVGFNVLPSFNVQVSDTLEAQHCGSIQLTANSTGYTLTLEASGGSDFPIGGVTHVMNAGTTNYTISEGSGTTLYYVDPGTGRTDTAGGCTIGPGGFATIWRQAAGTYYIWGSEITP